MELRRATGRCEGRHRNSLLRKRTLQPGRQEICGSRNDRFCHATESCETVSGGDNCGGRTGAAAAARRIFEYPKFGNMS